MVSDAVKVRLTERMGRLILAAYVSCGSPNLLLREIVEYTPRYKNDAADPWENLIRRAIEVEDDGHSAKFVRGLIHGQILSAK